MSKESDDRIRQIMADTDLVARGRSHVAAQVLHRCLPIMLETSQGEQVIVEAKSIWLGPYGDGSPSPPGYPDSTRGPAA
jgi:hypothetical protein